MAKIILLNGVGSAGKTSIAKALQDIAARPLLHVEMDAFLEMMPERYFDHPDGLMFEEVPATGAAQTAVRSGPVVQQTLSGMRQAVAGLARAGNDLVVDDVIFGNLPDGDANVVAEYRALLEPFDLRMVGVFAPLRVLESRERARGDRAVGLARWQYDRVHAGMTYELTVDTSVMTARECAEDIRDACDL